MSGWFGGRERAARGAAKAILRVVLPFLMAALVLMPSRAHAHPHVWVKVQTQILHDQEGRVTGLRHIWTFDEFYSAFATQGLDKDGDGTFNQAELEPLAAENVSSLSEFGYFTFVKADGKAQARAEPQDYRLDEVEGILTLQFTLPLKTPLDPVKRKLTFQVFDPTYFVAFDFDKANPVMLASTAPPACQAKFEGTQTAQAKPSDMNEAFFSALDASSDYGSQFARTVAIDCAAR